MAFTVARPSSPSPREPRQQIGQDELTLSSLPSPFHAGPSNATSSTPLTNSPPHHSFDLEMGKEKDRPHLEIILDSECLYLKGTGVDVEPARLSGHVALYLAESTSIKEITLQFRGKARLPVPPNELISLNNSLLTYIVCNHEWSFLEGEKKHSHTLKAGRHLFPFQIQLGGSLPSSVMSSAFGGASVAYKLRAHAVRSGFNHNLQTVVQVPIVRSFTSEALEYQQSLEIENTWPEKLMYSIMVPHKAWAAGDKITALVKFSPLVKGARVSHVTTSIHETTKVYARSGFQEHTATVATVKHEILGGKAVEVIPPDHKYRHSPGHTPPIPGTPSAPTSVHHNSSFVSSIVGRNHSPLATHSASPSQESIPHPISEAGSSSTAESESNAEEEPSENEVTTTLKLTIPLTITPSHTLEPIMVTHRIRWSILIANLDGHTSELRCSLPLHLLDHRLLEESRAHTAATRRLLLGGTEASEEEEEEMELPSYTAHVRDRVANMFLPEAVTMRVTNPWVRDGVSPTLVNGQPLSSWSRSGASSPLEANVLSQLPHAPGSGDSTPLDWVNSELMLSLSQGPLLPASQSAQSPTDSHPDSDPASRPESTPASSRPSRPASRAESPDHHHGPGHTAVAALPVAGSHETYVHGGHASRNLHNLFSASMKPFTSLTHPSWLSRSSSHTNLPAHAPVAGSGEQHRQQAQARGLSMPIPDPNTGSALLHRAFTEVPDYGVASRGFIGGVPPLSTMRGLPSYEETERNHGESDLVQRISHESSQSLTTSPTS